MESELSNHHDYGVGVVPVAGGVEAGGVVESPAGGVLPLIEESVVAAL